MKLLCLPNNECALNVGYRKLESAGAGSVVEWCEWVTEPAIQRSNFSGLAISQG